MCDGYDDWDDDIQPDLEDEFLCEYVDGTMDPVVKEVFEEYIRANPELREHIECLRHTRFILCHYGCRCRAPRDLQDQLRRRITCDLLQHGVPFHYLAADRLRDVATVSCAIALLLMIGFAAAGSFEGADDDYRQVVSAAVMNTQAASESSMSSHGRMIRASVMESAPITPRNHQIAPLSPARPLVASGIEHELRSASRATFAAAMEPLFP